MIDIVFVAYNSERWLDACVDSLLASDYDLRQVSLNFCDNASTDGTLAKLEAIRQRCGSRFGAFRVTGSRDNLGFGGGNNRAAALGSGELIFCLNIDTTVYPDTLSQIAADVAASEASVGLWELRQFPYEHPKFYDPLTQETSWSSGACFVMRRELWERLGGFDEHIFMYAEDVDLSWRVRAEGYTLRYIPKATINHYCYQSAGEIKPNQFIYSLINNLYLRAKFGTAEDEARWETDIQAVLAAPEPFPGAHHRLLKARKELEKDLAFAHGWRAENAKKLEGKTFRFLGWDYEVTRDGAFFVNKRPDPTPKVSVIVRTCGRPSTLRETLHSLRAQTYPNLEVVVVEDGPAVSEAMLREEFADLNLVYHATGEKVGRSSAGNQALALATGDYFNFLDDDDLFFADHVECLVSELEDHPEWHVAFSLAFETPIRVTSRDPYQYELSSYNGTIKMHFNRLEILHHNLFPIQAVMFDRQVYEEFGGLDESMDYLEDWDLWVRYATKYPFHEVWKTTSVYRTPMDRNVDAKRQKALDEALAAARKKHASYQLHWKSDELLEDYIAVCNSASPVSVPAEAAPAADGPHSFLYRALRKCYRVLRRVVTRLVK